MPTPTDLVTSLPADFEVFGQAVDSTMADLKGGSTGQILSKNSNTDMDFVWVAPTSGDITAVTAGAGISGGGTSGAVTLTRANVGCSVYNSTNSSIANNTQTTLNWDGEIIDSHGFHSTTTNTSRLTIPAGLGGFYQINVTASWDIASSAGQRSLIIYKNGSDLLQYTPQVAGSTSVYVGNTTSFSLAMVAGDYIEIKALQTSGGNLTVYQYYNNATFSMTYLGA